MATSNVSTPFIAGSGPDPQLLRELEEVHRLVAILLGRMEALEAKEEKSARDIADQVVELLEERENVKEWRRS
jgi:hypothetical protein